MVVDAPDRFKDIRRLLNLMPTITIDKDCSCLPWVHGMDVCLLIYHASETPPWSPCFLNVGGQPL